MEYDIHSGLFSIPDKKLSSIPIDDGPAFLINNNFEGDIIAPFHTSITETPVIICLDPVSDMVFLSSNPFIQESDSKMFDAFPNTCILTITETLLIDLPDDAYNGLFFGCDGFPQSTFIDLEYLPEKYIFDTCTIPPLPPVLGSGKYLRQVTIQPPFF